jgi:hypothetical protein
VITPERYEDLGRPEKILLAMGELSDYATKSLSYEDIVVKSWQLFPQEFGLRNYADRYPDASDAHKPLYGRLKTTGMVQSGNKKFKLTSKAIEYLTGLTTKVESKGKSKAKKVGATAIRLSRNIELELERIQQTEAFKLFNSGDSDQILDTDFFAYLGATVRTKKQEFLGKLATVEEAVVAVAKAGKNPEYAVIKKMHKQLLSKFSEIIDRRKG